MDRVLLYYANSLAEASFCGARTTRMRRTARVVVAKACDAGPDHTVVFCMAGAMAGVNRLVMLFGAELGTPVILRFIQSISVSARVGR